ncbi:MAG: protoporphyrinogen oxidase HemJ [Rickettsiales bacterium]|nr:protoporphyrinogen oxidase HemJ [Rickettsiales bacterium]
MELSVEAYLWLKGLHILAVICWMVGLLYLPRLFVYHCKVAHGSEADGLFQTMERKLMRGIMLPSMLATWGLGLWLAVKTGAFAPDNGGWLHAKLFLVLLLSGMHGMCGRFRKDFAKGQNRKSERFFRIFNEVPAVLMVCIVLLVVLKPF